MIIQIHSLDNIFLPREKHNKMLYIVEMHKIGPANGEYFLFLHAIRAALNFRMRPKTSRKRTPICQCVLSIKKLGLFNN